MDISFRSNAQGQRTHSARTKSVTNELNYLFPGSIAAWAQSFMGGTLAKGSLFSILQSASSGGAWAGPVGAIGAAAGAAYGYYAVNCDD